MGANVILGDIRDATAVTEAVAHADGVIHLAGVLGTQETIDNPRPAVETNVLGGLNVLEAAAQYDLPLVNIAVGNFWMSNTYAISKHTVERFADMMNRYRHTQNTVVRALNAYGPRQEPVAPFGSSKVRKILPSFICRALSGQSIEVYGDGEQVMDLVWAGDVARVLVQALEKTAKDKFGMMGLEAGSGNRTTVNDIAHVVAGEVELVTHRRVEIGHLPMRPGEEEHAVVLGDPKTLAPIGLDGSDFLPLDEGVKRTVAYFSEYLKPALTLAG